MNARALLLLLASLLTIQSLSQNQDWSFRNPLPQNDFFSIKFFNYNTGYVFGSGGAILKCTSGAGNWILQQSNTSKTLYSSHFFDVNTGFAVGGEGLILFTSNGGNNWQVMQSGTTQTLRSITFLNSNTGFAVGFGGTILKSTSGGSNWFQSGTSTADLYCVTFLDNNTGFISGSGGTILKTTNTGSSWELRTLKNEILKNIYFKDPQTGFIATAREDGYSTFPYKTSNGGNTWDTVYFSRIQSNWGSTKFLDQNTGYMLGENNLIMKTTNSGQLWMEIGVSVRTSLNDISIFDSVGFVCGSNGWITKVNPNNFTECIGGTRADFTSISFLNENVGSLVSGHEFLVTNNGGINWNDRLTGFTGWEEGHSEYVQSTHFFSQDALFMIRHYTSPGWYPNESIRKSTDGGSIWATGYTPQIGEFTGICYAEGVAYVSLLTNYRFVLKNVGLSWDTVYSSTTNTPGKLSFANQNTGVVLLSNITPSSYLRTTNGGLNWVTQQTGSNKRPEGIKMLSSGIGYMAGDSGLLMKTTNYGLNWILMNSGINKYFVDLDFFDDLNGWILATGINSPYIRNLYFTKNGGTNFDQITSLGPFSVKAFSFVNALTGFVCGDSGVVLKTTNGGLTFINQITGIVPAKYSLSQNYPNPFNPVTNIRFDIPVGNGRDRSVKLIIHDLLGREIIKLVDKELEPGSYNVDWDASNYPSGVYFYKLETGKFSESKKMILIK